MSLGIIFKGPEGLVLAADSRVTLMATNASTNQTLPAYYDNATKLLQFKGHKYVGVVTYGNGAIGQKSPRTAHSFLPEFESEVLNGNGDGNPENRLSIGEFANKLSEFYKNQWEANMPTGYSGPDMVFLVGGFNEGDPYGKVFEIGIPSKPDPVELNKDGFGIIWGGQREITDRIIQGYDPGIPEFLKNHLNLDESQKDQLDQALRSNFSMPIPYQFLPLQDCVDLSILVIRTTIEMQKWLVGVRGVGGAIDVATITRTKGFSSIQQKCITGEWKEQRQNAESNK